MRAFSLVELSIVLVILGLLTGGVLAGQSLIRAAELRSILADFHRFRTAVHTFSDKYMALPGDMPNATRFWGAADTNDGLGTDCAEQPSSDGTTCNGNGNGMIESVVAGLVQEKLRAWQHLSNAGLVEGRYLGTAGEPRSVMPASRVSPGLYELHYFAYLYRAQGNMLKLAGIIPSASPVAGVNGGILSADEAWNIDMKIDDGRSDNGKFMALRGANVTAGCVTNAGAYLPTTTGNYILGETGPTCRVYYFF